MTTNEKMSATRWRENASWVWNERLNRQLRRTATLRVTLRSTTTHLTECLMGWLGHFEMEEEDLWVWGGIFCSFTERGTHLATLELSSSGEDAFESLVHASRWLHREVVAAHHDVTAQWDELPLT